MAALAVVVGCAEEETLIDLSAFDQAPGGQIAAVALVETDDASTVVAPARDRLFVRDAGEMEWESFPARWPARIDDWGLEVFDVVNRASRHGDFVTQRYFLSFGDRLWTVALPAAGQRPLLLWSEDLGRSWREVPPPEEALDRQSLELGTPGLIPSLRFIEAEEDLFLVDGRGVWRWELPTETDTETSMWQAVDLEGVELGAQDSVDLDAPLVNRNRGRTLPLRLRHYLPAVDAHPYEIVTVHGAQLKVYRRGQDEEEFELVSTLDAVDRDLQRDPVTGLLFMLDGSGVYRSDDEGRNWEHLEAGSDSLATEFYSQLKIFANPSAEVDFTLWLGGSGGSLWRSDDGGENWQVSRSRDSDGRALTGLVAQDQGETFWMSTAGRGMWNSFDGGSTWQNANQGLNAAQTFDAAITDDGRVLIGTDAGLFERSTSSGEVHWEPIHHRATSAVYIHPDSQRIISGTLGGSIVVRMSEGEQHTSEAAPLGRSDTVAFEAPHLDSSSLSPSAIVHLTRRPGSQDIFAWSHQQGPMNSNDGGSSWRRMDLDEAFQNALSGSVVTHFLATRDQTYFAVTRSLEPNQPTQLWRSRDAGATWQATYSFTGGDEETPMRLLHVPPDGPLLMSHGSRLAMSVNQGDTWTSIAGPWERAALTGMGVADDKVVLLMHLPHTSEIVWLDEILESGAVSVSSRHRLTWPTNWRLFADRPMDMQIREATVLLNDSGTIYGGHVPRRQTRLPGSIAILVSLGTIFVLSAMGFGYLRQWGNR